MKIEKEVYNAIIKHCPPVPPETGGILGGYKDVISAYEFDRLEENCSHNSYSPNIGYLNGIIQQWSDKGIELYGIFHSHSSSETTLSLPDRGNIQRIME